MNTQSRPNDSLIQNLNILMIQEQILGMTELIDSLIQSMAQWTKVEQMSVIKKDHWFKHRLAK